MGLQPIVLLDEPQHHLDVHFQAILYQTLTKQRPNRLIIMAEHAQLAHHFATPTVLNFDAHLPRS
jgi:ABC-type bacteriocin/lantibiotic exporter with double-glycine peptidase domain